MNTTFQNLQWFEYARNIGQDELNLFKVDASIVIHKCYVLIHNFLDAIPNIIIGIFTLTLFIYIGKLVRNFVKKHTHIHHSVGLVLERLSQTTLTIFGALVAMAIIFPSVKPIDVLGGLGVISLAIGFALKDILNNFLSGIFILLQQPFKVGDEIKYKDIEGVVESITIRYTIMSGFDGRKFLIPNGEIYASLLVVNTAGEYRWTNIEIRVDLNNDIESIKNALCKAIQQVSGVLQEPKVGVVISYVHTQSVIFNCSWASAPYQKIIGKVKSEVLQAITQVLEKQIDKSGATSLNYKMKREIFNKK